MKKKFLICIIPIVLIIGIVIVVTNNGKKYQYEVEKLQVINYMLFLQNNRYGVIDKSGNIVVEPQYDIIEIPNPSKDVFICKSNYDESKKEYNVQVFNKEKQPILYQYYIVEAIELNNVNNNGFYEKSVLKYKSNGLYGLIDLSGKKITDAKYESIEGFEFNEGLMLVKKSGKYGIINMNGATIVKCNYDEILSDRFFDETVGYKNSGYIVGQKNGDNMLYGYISSSRKNLLKVEFEDIYRITEKSDDIYLVAFKEGHAGIYQKKKNIVPTEYEDIEYNAQNDVLIVQKNAKQGVMKFDGSFIVPIEYDNIVLAGSCINAKNGENVEVFDENGNKDTTKNIVSRQDFNNKKYAIVSTTDDVFKIINNESGTIIEDDFSYAHYMYDKYFIVKKDGTYGIIDDEGNSIIECKYKVIQPTLEYSIIQLLDKNESIEIVNKKFEVIADNLKSIVMSGNDNLLEVSTDSEDYYISKDGNLVDEAYAKNHEGLYPGSIGSYNKVDLGYGCPYYISKNN